MSRRQFLDLMTELTLAQVVSLEVRTLLFVVSMEEMTESAMVIKELALGRFFHRVAMSVGQGVCPLPLQICSRPLIGPQVT